MYVCIVVDVEELEGEFKRGSNGRDGVKRNSPVPTSQCCQRSDARCCNGEWKSDPGMDAEVTKVGGDPSWML
jgi:hypothetical protein